MILLDTHSFLWLVLDSKRLPNKTKELIDGEPAVYVSVASFWEMAIKSSLGKLQLPIEIDKLMEHCDSINIGILPIRRNHLVELCSLPWIHRDPFDRLIISQAIAEKMIVISTDNNFKKYNVSLLWD